MQELVIPKNTNKIATIRPGPVNLAVAGLFFAMAVTAKKRKIPRMIKIIIILFNPQGHQNK
jgi:hypothetical protein